MSLIHALAECCWVDKSRDKERSNVQAGEDRSFRFIQGGTEILHPEHSKFIYSIRKAGLPSSSRLAI